MTLAFDPPPSTDSALARLDPRWRLAGLVVSSVAAAVPRTIPAAGAACLAALILALVARLPLRWLLRRSLALALVLGPLLVLLPLFQGVVGLHLAVLIVLKGLALATFALILLGTAPLPSTLQAAQRLYLPSVLVQIALLSYRYVFVLSEELTRLRRALRVRGFRTRLDRRTYRMAGHVVGTLLMRGSERAEGVAQAMRCRAFDGCYRSLAAFHTRPRDVAFFAAMLTGAAGLVAWDVLTVGP